MSKVAEAKQILLGEINKYKSLKECMDYIESLEALEQYEKEATARIDALKKEETPLKAAKAQAEQIIDAAKSEAKTIKATGEKAIAVARVDADAIISDAKKAAETERASMQSERAKFDKDKAAADKTLSDVLTQITEETTRLDGVRAEVDLAQIELGKIKKAKADAVAKFTAMAGD